MHAVEEKHLIKIQNGWGTSVVQLVEHRTPSFDSGCDLGVMKSRPMSISAFSGESASDSLSPAAPPTHSLSLR